MTLTCSVQVTDRSDIIVTYQWSRDGQVIVNGQTGTYTIPNFQESNNGIFECVVLLSIDSINAPPVAWPVSRSVVSVGGKRIFPHIIELLPSCIHSSLEFKPFTDPMPPSPPRNPEATMITATSFTATWDPPVFDGRLSLLNFTVDIQRFGNSFCPGDLTFQPAVTGIGPNITSVTVESLYPSTQYQFRVVAFNFLFRSEPSTITDTFQTSPSGKSCTTDYRLLGSLLFWCRKKHNLTTTTLSQNHLHVVNEM